MNIDIEYLAKQEKKTFEQLGLKLGEEYGELVQALLSSLDAPGSEYKNKTFIDVQEEAVDVILVALTVFYKAGGTDRVFDLFANTKIKKWKEKCGLE